MEQNPLRFGLESQEEPAPFTVVIFGATGNLTRTRLIPALWSLFARGFFSRFRVIGFARRPWTDREFRKVAADALTSAATIRLAGGAAAAGSEERKREFLSRFDYISANFDDRTGYRNLAGLLENEPLVIHYLSTPPEAYPVIIERLGADARLRQRARIIVEKPFGHDLASARALNALLLGFFPEPQVYRIDHYLGKETVQNLMVLRFGNSIFEPIWNNRYIHHVQITMAETLGVEGRGNYYEQSGAVRDIFQNHLLQLLSLAAMEPPSSLQPEAVRNEKVKVLRSIRPVEGKDARSELVFGQYAAGVMNGLPVPGYRDEESVGRDSRVETYAAVRLFLDTWRWSGVPFFLRVGKRLPRRLTEIAVQFKRPPLNLFGGFASPAHPNVLVWRIQPDEGMRFTFNSKIPGFEPRLQPVQMRFSYGSAFGEESPDAYERLLLDVLHGDSTLFTRNDEIEVAWDITGRLRAAAAEFASDRLFSYPAGSAGPAEAKELTASWGADWRRL
jgi:glucose-6-phosphate 1-dehydrogenase